MAKISRKCYSSPADGDEDVHRQLTGPSGVCHSVEVSADSLYEAAIVGFNLLKQDGWVESGWRRAPD